MILKSRILSLFVLLLLVSCNNEYKDQYSSQGGDTPVDSQPTNDNGSASSISASSDSIITFKDFALIEKGGLGSGTVNYLLKKGFQFQSDTSASTISESLFVKPGTGDMVELLSNKDTDGSISFIINYYTKNNANYSSILNALDREQYKFDSRNKRYKYSIGTYEDLCVYPLGQISKNSKMYFLVKYLHYQGKELSTMPSEN
ncbi:MAG: hypothetical protein IPP51_17635 [Bacteroidetes bacterium]|nr:hypothetical protein [Bacteroidota bacterium]